MRNSSNGLLGNSQRCSYSWCYFCSEQLDGLQHALVRNALQDQLAQEARVLKEAVQVQQLFGDFGGRAYEQRTLRTA